MVGYVKPSNRTVVAGNPLVQEEEIETVTNMYAGRLVIKGTGDGQISVCGAGGAAIGWLGYEHTNPKYRPASRSTIYTVNSIVSVLNGPGIVVVGRLASGQNVAKGARLVAAANGELTAASAAAIPSGATTVTSSSAQPTVTGPLSTQGIVVAIAEESVDASGGAQDIMVRNMI